MEDELNSLKRVAARRQLEGINVECDEDNEDSYEFHSPCESSNEDDHGYLVSSPSHKSCKKSVKIANSYKAGTLPQDTIFCRHEKYKCSAIQNNPKRILHQQHDVRFTKNHKDRVGAKCTKEGCEWKIWDSWDGTP